jgi:hypothetical protein
MPTPENGKTIEEMYWELVRAMSPEERYNKALRLNTSIRYIVETRMREQNPDINDRYLKFAVAR